MLSAARASNITLKMVLRKSVIFRLVICLLTFILILCLFIHQNKLQKNNLNNRIFFHHQTSGRVNFSFRQSCSIGSAARHNPQRLVQIFSGLKGVDGQYPICLDSAVKPEPLGKNNKRCLVYSFGISDNWSFDEAMEEYGCQVFSFDSSINQTDHDHSEQIHFYNLGLGDKNDQVDMDGWTLKTLDSIYEMLIPRHGATIIDYLKIDIEWEEWQVLKQMLKSRMFDKVRQFSIEFHLPRRQVDIEGDDTSLLSLQDFQSLVKLVKKIENQMTRFESRLNPWALRRIRNLNNYYGSICFEMSFYQVLPYYA